MRFICCQLDNLVQSNHLCFYTSLKQSFLDDSLLDNILFSFLNDKQKNPWQFLLQIYFFNSIQEFLVRSIVEICVTIAKITQLLTPLIILRMCWHRNRVYVVLDQLWKSIDINKKVISDKIKLRTLFVDPFFDQFQQFSNDRVFTTYMFEDSLNQFFICRSFVDELLPELTHGLNQFIHFQRWTKRIESQSYRCKLIFSCFFDDSLWNAQLQQILYLLFCWFHRLLLINIYNSDQHWSQNKRDLF